MPIKIERHVMIYSSFTGEALTPAYDFGTGDRGFVLLYNQAHPMPQDEAYSLSDMLGDMGCTGLWTLPWEIKEETCTWLADCITATLGHERAELAEELGLTDITDDEFEAKCLELEQAWETRIREEYEQSRAALPQSP